MRLSGLGIGVIWDMVLDVCAFVRMALFQSNINPDGCAGDTDEFLLSENEYKKPAGSSSEI